MTVARACAELLAAGVADEAFPGGACCVVTPERVWKAQAGRFRYDDSSPEVSARTLWDMASVTKVMGTTTAAMLMHDDGLLPLDAPVPSLLPEFEGEGKDEVRVENLLLHDSGLPAYAQIVSATSKADALERVLTIPLRAKPGKETVYSCLGFVTLKTLVERLAKEPIDRLLERRAFGPLGMRSTRYNPPRRIQVQCTPTEPIEPWRRKVQDERGLGRVDEVWTQGQVHDPIAFMVGGVSGNAGLFSDANDVARFLSFLLSKGASTTQIVCAATIEEWTSRKSKASSRGYGWDTISEESSAGSKFGPKSFGHTGFTGTSLWVDPEAGLAVGLLTNRVHPTAENMKLMPFRRRFHDAVWDAVGRSGS